MINVKNPNGWLKVVDIRNKCIKINGEKVKKKKSRYV